MVTRTLLAAIVAGALAGAFVTAAQMLEVVPLIVEAEGFETGAHAAGGHSHGEDAAAHSHGTTLMPGVGVERAGLTLVANLVIGSAFGLLLAAAMTLRGRPVDWKTGLLWGLAGFAVFSLAPALGLPPKLPGSIQAGVVAQQAWWLATAAATAGGLALVVFSGGWLPRIAGAALIAVPHIVGAPLPESLDGSVVPGELAAQFVVASLVTALAFWALLGSLTGLFVDRWAQRHGTG